MSDIYINARSGEIGAELIRRGTKGEQLHLSFPANDLTVEFTGGPTARFTVDAVCGTTAELCAALIAQMDFDGLQYMLEHLIHEHYSNNQMLDLIGIAEDVRLAYQTEREQQERRMAV